MRRKKTYTIRDTGATVAIVVHILAVLACAANFVFAIIRLLQHF